MRLELLVAVGAFVLGAIAFAVWLTRDELDTLPRDVDDEAYRRWLEDFEARYW